MGVTIVEDTRQKSGKHELKHRWWEAHGIEVVRRKLDFGDYVLDVGRPTVSIDTKASVAEVASNISGQHARFRRECLRAACARCSLIVLVENVNNIETVRDVAAWTNDVCLRCRMCNPRKPGDCTNPRLKSKRKPIQGARLSKAMATMGERYGVDFRFCRPQDAARIITEILEADAHGR